MGEGRRHTKGEGGRNKEVGNAKTGHREQVAWEGHIWEGGMSETERGIHVLFHSLGQKSRGLNTDKGLWGGDRRTQGR